MKRILALILTALLVMSVMNFSVLASTGSIGFSVKITEGTGGDIIYTVDMKGVCGANDRVFIEAQLSGIPIVIEQLTSDSTGNFTLSKSFSTAGTYIVNVAPYSSDSFSSSFTLKEKSYYEAAIGVFNTGLASDIITKIDTDGESIGINLKYYNSESKSAIAAKITQVDEAITLSNLAEIFDKCVALTYLSTPSLYAKADEILAYYDSYLNIKNSTGSMYNDFTAFDGELKNKILTEAFGELTDTATASSAFNFSVAKNAITGLSAIKLDEFILAHNDSYYGFLGYEDLDTVKKSQLISGLKAENLGTTQADLLSAYNRVIADINGEDEIIEDDKDFNQSVSTGPSGGGGGGSMTYNKESLVKPLDVTENQISFDDLDSAAWAKEAILTLAKRGVINGKGEKLFAPSDNISRKEYAKILALAFELHNEGAQCSYSDVSSSDWAYSYIASMHKHGLITGYPDGSFGADRNITRQDIAVVLYRHMLKNKYITNVTSVTGSFKDTGSIAEYAQASVLMLAQIGLITGNEEGYFNPSSPATRAEVCVIINRALEYIKNNKQ